MSSAVVPKMKIIHRVFIASGLSQGEIPVRYKTITESGAFHWEQDRENADLIVVDLDHPPEDLGIYFAYHLYNGILAFAATSEKPCLFLGATQSAQSHEALGKVKDVFKTQPKISGSLEQLLEDMKQVQTSWAAATAAIWRKVTEFQRVNP